MTLGRYLSILVTDQSLRAIHRSSRPTSRAPGDSLWTTPPPAHPVPSLDDLTHSLHTPLERIAVEHAELVEAVRRRVVAERFRAVRHRARRRLQLVHLSDGLPVRPTRSGRILPADQPVRAEGAQPVRPRPATTATSTSTPTRAGAAGPVRWRRRRSQAAARADRRARRARTGCRRVRVVLHGGEPLLAGRGPAARHRSTSCAAPSTPVAAPRPADADQRRAARPSELCDVLVDARRAGRGLARRRPRRPTTGTAVRQRRRAATTRSGGRWPCCGGREYRAQLRRASSAPSTSRNDPIGCTRRCSPSDPPARRPAAAARHLGPPAAARPAPRPPPRTRDWLSRSTGGGLADGRPVPIRLFESLLRRRGGGSRTEAVGLAPGRPGGRRDRRQPGSRSTRSRPRTTAPPAPASTCSRHRVDEVARPTPASPSGRPVWPGSARPAGPARWSTGAAAACTPTATAPAPASTTRRSTAPTCCRLIDTVDAYPPPAPPAPAERSADLARSTSCWTTWRPGTGRRRRSRCSPPPSSPSPGRCWRPAGTGSGATRRLGAARPPRPGGAGGGPGGPGAPLRPARGWCIASTRRPGPASARQPTRCRPSPSPPRCGPASRPTLRVPVRAGTITLPDARQPGAARPGGERRGDRRGPARFRVRAGRREQTVLARSGGAAVDRLAPDPRRVGARRPVAARGRRPVPRLLRPAGGGPAGRRRRRGRWAVPWREAWRVVHRDVPAHAAALDGGLRAVVPLAPDPARPLRSATARHAFGAVAVTPDPDPEAMAVLLVHEWQHAKLGAVLDLYDLVEPGRRHPDPGALAPRPAAAGGRAAGRVRPPRRHPGWRSRAAADRRRRVGARRPVTWPGPGTASTRCWPAGRSPRRVSGSSASCATPWRRPVSGPDERQPPALGRLRLADDLRALGVRPGACLLVHCALRRVGPLEHGPATLAGALRDVLGPAGTLAGAHPDRRQLDHLPGLPGGHRRHGPGAARAVRGGAAGLGPPDHPVAADGALAEYVRCAPGAVRSDHPQTSFAALGPRARQLTDGHDLTCHLGERSPLGGALRGGRADPAARPRLRGVHRPAPGRVPAAGAAARARLPLLPAASTGGGSASTSGRSTWTTGTSRRWAPRSTRRRSCGAVGSGGPARACCRRVPLWTSRRLVRREPSGGARSLTPGRMLR